MQLIAAPIAPAPAAELSPVVEERRPAPSPLLDERPGPLCGAAVGVAGQQIGGKPGPFVLNLGRQDLGPVHAGGLEFFRPHVREIPGNNLILIRDPDCP